MKASGGENRQRVRALKDEGKSIKEIEVLTNLKKPTIYAYLRDDKPKAKVVAKNGGATGPSSLKVTPTKSGSFLVDVPADRLARVAQALA